MSLPRVDTDRLVLHPVTVPVARWLTAGNTCGLPVAAGWPHEQALVGLAAGLAAADAGAGTDALGWLACRADTGEVVGECAVKGSPGAEAVAEISYGLAPGVRGQGLGGDLVAALVGHLRERGDVRLVVAEAHAANAASRAVLERLGFHLAEGRDGRCRYELAVPGAAGPG